jgi:hypothetical protein
MPRAFDLELERRWRDRFHEFEQSGLSVRRFCRAEAVREHTFFYWRRELAKRDRLRQAVRSAARQKSKLPPHDGRRQVNGNSHSCQQHSHRPPTFVPVQVVSDPLGTMCMEFRFATCLVRVPTTIDEQTLRQAIRILREEAAAC